MAHKNILIAVFSDNRPSSTSQDFIAKQANAEHPTIVEKERVETTKSSTEFRDVSKNPDIEETLLDHNDINHDIIHYVISSNEQSRAPTSESTSIKDYQGTKILAYNELKIDSVITEIFQENIIAAQLEDENVEDFHAKQTNAGTKMEEQIDIENATIIPAKIEVDYSQSKDEYSNGEQTTAITNHTSTFETYQEHTVKAHIKEEQANADFPTEVEKEREEETKFFTENIDVENVTIILAFSWSKKVELSIFISIMTCITITFNCCYIKVYCQKFYFVIVFIYLLERNPKVF